MAANIRKYYKKSNKPNTCQVASHHRHHHHCQQPQHFQYYHLKFWLDSTLALMGNVIWVEEIKYIET